MEPPGVFNTDTFENTLFAFRHSRTFAVKAKAKSERRMSEKQENLFVLPFFQW